MYYDYPTISCVIRTPPSPIDACGYVGVSISTGIINLYNVFGHSLHNIANVAWFPRSFSSVKFRIIPFTVSNCNNTQGTFGIIITDNYYNFNNRGGVISFLKCDGCTIAFPTMTYGNINLPWKGPLLGNREFET